VRSEKVGGWVSEKSRKYRNMAKKKEKAKDLEPVQEKRGEFKKKLLGKNKGGSSKKERLPKRKKKKTEKTRECDRLCIERGENESNKGYTVWENLPKNSRTKKRINRMWMGGKNQIRLGRGGCSSQKKAGGVRENCIPKKIIEKDW